MDKPAGISGPRPEFKEAPMSIFSRPFPTFGLLFSLAFGAGPALAGVVATGTFQSKENGLEAAGSFEILESGGKHVLSVKSDFRIASGPDLNFAFHPLQAAQVTGANAKTNSLRITKLKSLSGAQTYDLPLEYEPGKYPSLIIHCWQFNHLYAAGTVKLTPTAIARPGQKTDLGNRYFFSGRGRWLAGGPQGSTVDVLGKTPIPSLSSEGAEDIRNR